MAEKGKRCLGPRGTWVQNATRSDGGTTIPQPLVGIAIPGGTPHSSFGSLPRNVSHRVLLDLI